MKRNDKKILRPDEVKWILRIVQLNLEAKEAGKKFDCEGCLDTGIILYNDPPAMSLCNCPQGDVIWRKANPIVDNNGQPIGSNEAV